MKRSFVVVVLIFFNVFPLYGQDCYVGVTVRSQKYESREITTNLQGYRPYTYGGEWDVGETYEPGEYVEHADLFWYTAGGGTGQEPGVSGDWVEVHATETVYRKESSTISYDYHYNLIVDYYGSYWCPPIDTYDKGESKYVQTSSYDDSGNIVNSGCSGGGSWDFYYNPILWEFYEGRYVNCDYYLASMTWAGLEEAEYRDEPTPYCNGSCIYNLNIDNPDDSWDDKWSTRRVYGSLKNEEDEGEDYPLVCPEIDSYYWETYDRYEETTLELFERDSVHAALARWNRSNRAAVWTPGTRETSVSLLEDWTGLSFTTEAVRVTLELEGCPGEYLVRYYLDRRSEGGGPGDWVRDGQPSEERVTITDDCVDGRVLLTFLLPIEEGKEVRVSGSLDPLTPVFEVVSAVSGPSLAQNCGTDLKSVHWQLSLGFGDLGYSMGRLSIEAETITPDIYTPAILRYGSPSSSATVIYASGEEIRQILVPQGLADVQPLGVGEGFEISFYHAEDVEGFNPTSGLYEWGSGATPFVVWTVDNPDISVSERVRIAQTTGNTGEVYIYAYDDINDSWSLDRAGLVHEELTEVVSGSDLIVTRVLRETLMDPVVSKSRSTYREYPWGTELISEVLSPDVDSQTTTWDFYDNEMVDGAAYGKLKSVEYPDGNWERYEYDNDGRLSKIVSPWLDSEITTGSDAAHRVREITYTTDVVNTEDVWVQTEVTHILGEETSRRFLVDWVEGAEESGTRYRKVLQIQAHEPGADWDDADNPVTETWSYWDGDFMGRPWRILNPDGTMILYAYGVDRSGESPANPIGKIRTVWRGEPALNGLSVVKGTLEELTTDSAGNMLYRRSVDIESGLSLGNSWTTQQDELGRPTRIDYEDGTFELFSYSCCGLSSRTGREGIETTYEYDDLKRLVRTTTAGVSRSGKVGQVA